jgi:hypothetical protein
MGGARIVAGTSALSGAGRPAAVHLPKASPCPAVHANTNTPVACPLQLTRLLEPSLTGAARTLVIITASALPTQREQMLATLRCVLHAHAQPCEARRCEPAVRPALPSTDQQIPGRVPAAISAAQLLMYSLPCHAAASPAADLAPRWLAQP